MQGSGETHSPMKKADPEVGFFSEARPEGLKHQKLWRMPTAYELKFAPAMPVP